MLKSAGEVVCGHDVGAVCSQLFVVAVVKSLHCCLLDRAVHPLDLAAPRQCRSERWRSYGSFNEDRVDVVRHRFELVPQELPRRALVRLFNDLGDGELACSINADKELQLFLHRLGLGYVDMKMVNWLAFERRRFGLKRSSRLSFAREACDRCIAALTTCVASHGLRRSHSEFVPYGLLSFLRKDPAIKPWG